VLHAVLRFAACSHSAAAQSLPPSTGALCAAASDERPAEGRSPRGGPQPGAADEPASEVPGSGETACARGVAGAAGGLRAPPRRGSCSSCTARPARSAPGECKVVEARWRGAPGASVRAGRRGEGGRRGGASALCQGGRCCAAMRCSPSRQSACCRADPPASDSTSLRGAGARGRGSGVRDRAGAGSRVWWRDGRAAVRRTCTLGGSRGFRLLRGPAQVRGTRSPERLEQSGLSNTDGLHWKVCVVQSAVGTR